MPDPTPSKSPSGPTPHPPETIKDTLISIMIAFTMAFVFRGFVIEAFVIPTGSMAPTLMGAHMQWRGPSTGYQWPVGATQPQNPNDNTSYSDPQTKVQMQDPISGDSFPQQDRRTYSGDRILVLKYLYALRDPTRFDVIVFKNPQNPADNYIKRLIGLPGEQIALADGDVFVRTNPADREPPHEASAPAAQWAKLWELEGWKIARKDPITQRSVWQLVYDSAYAPLTPAKNAGACPWRPSEDDKSWKMDPREYSFQGTGEAQLVFDQNRRRSASEVQGGRAMTWVIDDYYPYDETSYGAYISAARYPVSDIRMRCGYLPKQDGSIIRMELTARGHEFRASLGAGKAEIAWRPIVGAAGVRGAWETVKTQAAPALPANKVANVEFWHVDQSVQIWLDGKPIASFEYDWSPGQRLQYANPDGKPLAELLSKQARDPFGANVLAEPSLYSRCDARLAFTGGPFTLYRVGLDRDLHYQPATKHPYNNVLGPPALGTNPYQALILSPDQFFACGDNSPASLDGRLWTDVDPWVNEQYPVPDGPYPSAGVIPRDLLLGKAFFVYWPSLKYEGDPVPVPDFGRMRFIW